MKYFALVLHSHLPYCRQAGVWPFGEEWVLEAMAETYVPLLTLLKKYSNDKIRVGLSFSPVLVEQLKDPYMQGRFLEFLEAKEEAAREDEKRFTQGREEKLAALAADYLSYYRQIRRDYQEILRGDFLGTLRELREAGVVELLMGAATHGYLPLLEETALWGQLATGKEAYRHYFQGDPQGIWLPECAYRPGLETYLEELGLKYFIVDGHAIRGGHVDAVYRAPGPTPSRGVTHGFSTLKPYYTGKSKVAVFGRDQLTGLQVWSEDWGYPTDGSYREFHKRDEKSGFHYWRITGPGTELEGKDVYDPSAALAQVAEDARDFVDALQKRSYDHDPAIVLAPFDVELFGHWWREGILWLERVFQELSSQGELEMLTPCRYLALHAPEGSISLPECSWGQGGRHYIWQNGATAWLWSQLEEATKGFAQRAGELENPDPWQRRVLAQGARECLLLQASDWPFLISTGQAADYASRRFLDHLSRLERLLDGLVNDERGESFNRFLEELEAQDNIFPFIDYRHWSRARLQQVQGQA
ncbi:MAG: 1,4-alpha-glucan branching protein domain-containing protein [Limnochordia bacterium]|jgi:1,4-alpha-glucan branching enzyme